MRSTASDAHETVTGTSSFQSSPTRGIAGHNTSIGNSSSSGGARSRGSSISDTRSAAPLASKREPSRPRDPRPKFPSIKIELLSNDSQSYVECPANSRNPIPFETALFKGTLLIMHQTTPVDEFYKHMFTVPKNFEVQMQGKFKKVPTGELYCGAEAGKKMELGIFTRGIANSVLALAGTMINGTMHYSYGDVPRADKNFEVPHLVAPMFSSLGKVIVTPPHEAPPALGTAWNENPEYNKQRKKFRSVDEIGISLENTYSFGVFTGNLDLVNWNITGIPLKNSVSMTNFFGDSCIQLVSYEYPKDLIGTDSPHPQNRLKYIFALKLTPLLENEKVVKFVNEPSDDERESDLSLARRRLDTFSDIASGETATKRNGLGGGGGGGGNGRGRDVTDDINQNEEFDSNDEDSGDERVFKGQNDDLLNIIESLDDEDPLSDNETRDHDQGIDERGAGMSPPDNSKENSNSPLHKKRMSTISGDDVENEQGENIENISGRPKDKEDNKFVSWFKNNIKKPADVVLDVPEAAEISIPDSHFEFVGDLRYCPACIEVSDFRSEFRRRVVYMIPSSGHTVNMHVPTAANSSIFLGRLVSYSEFAKLFTMVPIPKLHKNKKMAFEEKRRRQIVETHKNILLNSSKANAEYSLLQKMLDSPTEIDNHFLSKPPNIIKKPGKSGGIEKWEGAVAYAKSHRHWVEMHLTLSKSGVAITKHMGATRRSLQILLPSIIAVKILRPEESPIPYDFPIFQVETVSRVHYFLVRNQKQVEEWLVGFKSLISINIVKAPNDAYVIQPTITFSENEDAYLAKPSGLKIEKRRIFNYRKIIFRPECIPESFSSLGIPGMVESILRKSFELVNSITHENTPREVSLWITLLDEISSLQMMDFAILDEKERIAVFLNIYHSMILHGGIVLGLPIAWTNWQFFFNTVTYILGCELVSIAELEFSILRASMSKSSSVISKTFSSSTSFFPQFAINVRDFRLNFAINSGSISMSQKIPIYRAQSLDRDLDEITSIMVNDSETGIDTNSQKKIIVLPKICSSFLQDFSFRNQSTSEAQLDCVRALSCYIHGEARQTLNRMLSFSPAPTIRFKPFNFACRKLVLLLEDSSKELSPSPLKTATEVTKGRDKADKDKL